MEGSETKNEARFSREEEAKAQVELWRYAIGFSEMAVVKCAIEMGIADVLESHEGRPITLNELSSTLNCSPSLLHRIMRFLMHRGIFKQEETREEDGHVGYVQTPLSRLLTTSHGDVKSMAALVLLETTPVMLAPWQGLRARVSMKRASTFEDVHGADLWKYGANSLVHNRLFNDGMACRARNETIAIIEQCPEVFEGISSLVDVGGGDGTTIRTLVKAFPWILRGINFDLPHVVSAAPAAHCDDDKVEHVGGDMLHTVPKANATFLMSVLHDWGDDECIRILKNCREAIPQDTGKVIIAEAVIDEDLSDEEKRRLEDVRLMLDMVMIAHTTNGKERTAKEWIYVLEAAGFSRYTFKQIQAVPFVIEAYP